MSWKSKLKTVGKFVAKNVLTLGIGYLVDKYASKKVSGAVKDVLDAVVNQKTVPVKLQPVVDGFMRDLPPVSETIEHAMIRLGPLAAPSANLNLSKQAAALRPSRK